MSDNTVYLITGANRGKHIFLPSLTDVEFS
jgi:hypothetical protein